MRCIENEMRKGQQPTTPAARRRGRPALPTEEGKRYAVGIRTTKKLKDSLQHAADSSGRSVAQEIESRLERSFLLETILGTPEAVLPAAAFALAGQQAAEACGHPAADWRNDRHCYETALLALVAVLWRQHPAPGWRAIRHWLQRVIGRLAAPYRAQLNDDDLTLKASAIDLATPVED
jgi:hypothetical protein